MDCFSPSPLPHRRSKYGPLGDYLRAFSGSEVTLAFSAVEDIIGSKLPASAKKHRAWWSNEAEGHHTHAKVWLGAGWRVRMVSLDHQSVTFARLR